MSEPIFRDFSPRSRAQWAHQIGMFLGRLGELETLTHHLRLLTIPRANAGGTASVSEAALSGSWLKAKFEARLDKLIATCSRDEELKQFIPHLEKTKSLVQVRNVLAHGSFAVKEGSTSERPNYCFFCYPEPRKSDLVERQPSVVHIEQLEQAMDTALDITFGLHRLTAGLSERKGIQIAEKPARDISFAQRCACSTLQLNIGLMIVAMGEVEVMLTGVYQKILSPDDIKQLTSHAGKPSGYWYELTFAKMLDDLLEILPAYGEYSYLRETLHEAKALIDGRNTLAHAIVEHAISETGSFEPVAVRQIKPGPHKVSRREAVSLIKRSMALSDNVSRAIARVQFQLHHERRRA